VKAKRVTIEAIEGPGNLIAVYIDDYRVAGPKPWGGGVSVFSLQADVADLRKALRERGKEPKSRKKTA
jgi:hypothetical protein